MARNGKFIFGALLGAVFGLAFAPKKGSDLRKELKTELDKGGHGEKTLRKNAVIIGEDISSTAQEVYQDPAVQTQIKKGQKEAGKLIEQAKEGLQSSGEEWLQVAREKLIEGKTTLQKEAVKAFDTLTKKPEPTLKKAPAHQAKSQPAQKKSAPAPAKPSPKSKKKQTK